MSIEINGAAAYISHSTTQSAYPFTMAVWVRITPPKPPRGKRARRAAFYARMKSVRAWRRKFRESLTDGRPSARHTYDYEHWEPELCSQCNRPMSRGFPDICRACKVTT